MQESDINDAFGKALMDYWKQGSAQYFVARDDGYKDKAFDIGVYFSTPDAWKRCETEIIKHSKGRVLDIGGGAGRFALHLQKQGHEVSAVDISPLACEVMLKRGIRDVRLLSLSDLDGCNIFVKSQFDTVLMMYNNFGLAGNITATLEFLAYLHKITSENGQIITTIRNPYITDKPEHLSYQERNRRRGRYSGQVTIRIEYQDLVTSWFDLLMVSPEELEQLARQTDWKVVKTVIETDKIHRGYYGAVLEKRGG